jgi:hypothetical protein
MLEQPMIEKLTQPCGCRAWPRLEGAGTRSGGARAEFPGTARPAGGSAVELARESGAGAALESAKLRTTPAWKTSTTALRGLDKSVIRALAQESPGWQARNIFVLGPTGVGKSFVACALGAEGLPRWILGVLHARGRAVPRSGHGARRRQLAQSAGAAEPHRRAGDRRLGHGAAVGTERRDFWEICEDRYQTRSTILTSQLPVSRWHEQIGDPTWPTASSTGWCTTPTASRCAAIRCARIRQLIDRIVL